MSTPTSKLTSLLQFRFVKRDTNSSPSSSENGSHSSNNDTLPPSQNSTVPPSTPDIKLSLPSTPDKCSVVSSTVSSPPESPIFSSKSKIIDRNKNATMEKAVPTSSQWLSKLNGPLTNGVARTKKSKKDRKFPILSDDSDDDILIIDEDLEEKMSYLRMMFPGKSDSDMQQTLLNVNGDVKKAIDVLISAGKTKYNRIRQQSQDTSTLELDLPVQPRKRIRHISSDSIEDISTAASSQMTASYNFESQCSDATINYEVDFSETLTSEQEKKITFLSNCFTDKSKQELHHILTEHTWNVADATVAMSSSTTLKAATLENKNRSHAESLKKKKGKEMNYMDNNDDDEEDDNEYSGADSDASDNSIKDEDDAGKKVILDFYEDASLEELMATPGCSKKKSEIIISNRPYQTWEKMIEKFTTVKGLSYDLVSGCQEVIKIQAVVKRLMKRCEEISSSIEQVVSDLLHSNTQLDDANQITKQPTLLNPDLQLKPFQMVALNWLRIMHNQELNGILADEMGLGKTIQTIAFLAHLLEEGELGPHAIIVPSSTIDNWIRECKVWCPALKVLVYCGSQVDRRAMRQHIMYNNEDTYNLIITTYNMATGSVEDRALFKKFQFHYAIFDEGHLLKNMSSLRYQNLMKIRADRRLLLTGTPLQNNLLELMSLLCFVMPDMFIGKTEQLKRMFTIISYTSNDEKRSRYQQERITHAKQILKPFVLRRLKSEVMNQLPKKLESLEYCTMIPDQQELYDRLIHNFTSQLCDVGEDITIHRGAGFLMQLRKAANHPLLHRLHYNDEKIKKMAEVLCEEPSHKDRGALPHLVVEDMLVMSDFELHKTCQFYKHFLSDYMLDKSCITDSGKFRFLDQKLDEHKGCGDRVLLFSQFTAMLDILEVLMKQKNFKYQRLDGSTPVVERQKLIDEYNNNKDMFVFLLSTKAGGLGINLTSANVVILHDIDFNPYNDKQAEDRCHRVGQTREVQIIKLISKNSVEEAMLKCCHEKLKLEKDVISTDNQDDDTENPKDVASILRQALQAQKIKLRS